MESAFIDLIERVRAAVIVKDDSGYCVHANRREEELRGVAPGSLIGKHVTELADADPILVERAWERFRREGAWVGQYRTHDTTGQALTIRSYNFVHREWDGNLLYVSFGYVLQRGASDRNASAAPHAAPLTPEDRCILQLLVDGHSDEEIALLLGASPERARDLIEGVVQRAGASSRTEACVRALKSHLVL